MKILGIAFMTLALVAFASLWGGFVLVKLWTWFIVTTFNATPLSLPQAIGIATVIRYLTWQYSGHGDTKGWGEIWFTAFFVPCLSLFTGWIVHLFLR